MESPVTGGLTPLSLGELRQAILAVLVGNPLFTPEEQLRANHQVHECESPERLARWDRNVAREAARRALLARAQELAGQWSCVADTATMEAEMLRVIGHPRFVPTLADDIKWLFYDAQSDARRRQVIAAAYKMLLRHTGRLQRLLS